MTSILTELRSDIRRTTHADEKAVMDQLMAASQIDAQQHQRIHQQAVSLWVHQ